MGVGGWGGGGGSGVYWAEMTHQSRPKRPTLKSGRNCLTTQSNDSAAMTHSGSDRDSNPFFLFLYTARPSFEYYQQVYFTHCGLQDESLQVTISKLL